MIMYNGIFFNILQIVAIYLCILANKKKNKKYSASVGWIYIISVLLRIVKYNVVTIVLFVVQIFVLLLSSSLSKEKN